MFKRYNETFLARKLGITREEFHRELKKLIVRDFKQELNQIGLTNPDIALDTKDNMFLVHPYDDSIYYQTNTNISDYI